MYDGTLRSIETVRVGDKMMGPDSEPRTVLDLFHGSEPMYRVRQTSANYYDVNGAHVLVLKKSASCVNDKGGRMPSGNWRRSRGRYPDWPDEVEITVEDWLKQSKRWKENFRGFRAGVIHFPGQAVDIDPYLLGLWLGDGLHRELMITTADSEIIDWLNRFSRDNGLLFTISEKYGHGNRAVDVRLGRNPAIHGRKNPVWQGFKKNNLVSNKHIPEQYFKNSEDVRLRLLAGIIDTDGTYARGGYDVCLANERLADDVKRLADGLGFRTSIRRKQTTCKAFRGVAWRVSINGDTPRVPCLLPRKKASVSPNKDKALSYISIEPIGVGEYYGVLLDGDHRFLLADGTVTHNSGKSWAYARALLIQAIQKPLRVLCAREIQRSIKDSVHKLLSDQIQLMGLGKLYTITETEIRGINGSNFTFAGLGNQTVESIKSYEGVDICWVEEGQTISDRSWTILIPTIRKANSEIWISFNPDLDTDPTYTRFVVNPPDEAVVVQVNYSDNPFFNDVMEKERLHCQKTDPVGYLNIWEGQCRPAVEGAIYHDQITAAGPRITNVPYDPMLKVHVVLDLGWNDAMAIALVQRQSSEVRIIEYIEDSHRTLADYSAQLKDMRLSWGKMFLPHDGRAKDFKTGKSAAQIMAALGWDVEITENFSIEEGIRLARLMFPRVYFDKTKSARLVECLKRYRRRINQATEEPGAPLHDEFSHGADCFRYIACNVEQMHNQTPKRRVVHVGYAPHDRAVGY
jgi:phage terminase large subunit